MIQKWGVSLLLGLFIVPLGVQAATVDCDPSWPVAVKKMDGYEDLFIRVKKGLIKNQKNISGNFLAISSQYGRLTELRSQTLLGTFVNRSRTEQWLPLGSVQKIQSISGATCYKVALAPDVKVSEVVRYSRSSCGGPMSTWACGKKKSSYLQFNKKGFAMRTLTGVTAK